MSVLTIDGTEYPLQAGVQVEYIKLDRQRRAWSGAMRSSLGSDSRTYVRAWSAVLGHLSELDATTLLGVLLDHDSFVIAGDLPGGSVTCLCVDVQRQDGPLDDMVTIRCQLEEVG